MLSEWDKAAVATEVREVFYDLQGKVVSLLDEGENIIATLDGSEEVTCPPDRLDKFVAAVAVATGKEFEEKRVGDPGKCRWWFCSAR